MDQWEDDKEQRNNVQTRFVIVEKYIKCRYYTPNFDCNGNVIQLFSGWFSSGISVVWNTACNDYASEIKLYDDLIEYHAFKPKFEITKLLSLLHEYEDSS